MMHCWAKRRHLHRWRPPSTLGLDPVSSHSPSAPLILSKSHYNPTNPTASHHDCLLSGSPALHIRIWNWAGGSFSPHYHLWESWFSPVKCAFSSSLLVNALEAWPLGSTLGRWVVIQSVLEEAFFIGPWGPLLAFVLTHVLLQKNTQSEEKLLMVFCKMWSHSWGWCAGKKNIKN